MAYNYNQATRFNTDGNAQDVLISGNNAYVTDGSSGLQILDVTDPTNPILSSTYSGGNYENLSNFSFFSGTLGLFGFTNPIAVYEQTKGWDILNVDLTDPSNPVTVSVLDSLQISFTQELSNSGDGYVSGNYVYVADGEFGLQVFNVADITNSASMEYLTRMATSVTATGSYDTDGIASGVFVEGNSAYVADGEFGLQIIDITDPTNPILAGSYDTAGTATDVSVSGSFAYVADTTGLQIIDVSNPSAPTAAYVYEASEETTGVSVYGNYIYVTDGNAGLKVLNLIDGSASDDSLSGSGSKEVMLGSSGADTIKGFGGADVLAGGGDNDKLLGGGGADTMVGGNSNDVLVGGGGSDVLIGVNPYEDNPGAGEKDLLQGSAGADTFVLGDENNIFYYDNGLTKADGNAGRATIKDFDSNEGDIIQLNINGTYELVEINGSTRIYATSDSGPDDYIAIVSGVTGLDLADSSQFDYAGSVL